MKLFRNPAARVVGATLLAPISWGTTYIVITELLPPGHPLPIAVWRVLPAGLVLLAFGRLFGGSAAAWRPKGRAWLPIAAVAVTNFAVFFPLLIAAAQRLPGGVAASAGGLQPLLVAAFGWLLTGRRPRSAEFAVGGAAALGVAMIVVGPRAELDPLGVLAAVGANASFAVGVVLTRKFGTPPNPLSATGWQLMVGGLIMAPLALAFDGFPPALDLRNVAGIAYLSLVGTAVAFAFWFRGIRRLAPSAPPLLGLAAPITGALLGWLLLGQTASPIQVAGFAITVGAIARGAILSQHSLGATASSRPARRAAVMAPSTVRVDGSQSNDDFVEPRSEPRLSAK